jgi:hypothetical protein
MVAVEGEKKMLTGWEEASQTESLKRLADSAEKLASIMGQLLQMVLEEKQEQDARKRANP